MFVDPNIIYDVSKAVVISNIFLKILQKFCESLVLYFTYNYVQNRNKKFFSLKISQFLQNFLDGGMKSFTNLAKLFKPWLRMK